MKKAQNKPLISVLIPVYNGALYLKETVNSVRKSTYKNVEIILVDDGSTDNSRELCRGLAKKYKNVRFYHFPRNSGLTRSLNFGIKKAKGKYIARINQDDLLVPSRFDKQMKFLEGKPDYVAVGGYIKLFSNDKYNLDLVKFPLSDKAIRDKWLYFSPFADPTVTFEKSAYLKTKGYSQKMWPADDVHMWYQLGKIGKLKNLPFVLTKVRWHDGAGSIRFHKIQMKKTWEVHLWAAKNVQKPKLSHWIFWSGQYIAGVLLPSRFNWYVYRLIKRIIAIKHFSLSSFSSELSLPSFSLR